MIQELNAEQQRAVENLEGPFLVLAGAGSGKTRVVTCRIVHLLQKGVFPSKILGVTFTNKAAAEMRERVNRLTQANVLICTFHSLGARILRQSIEVLGYNRNFFIYDPDDIDKVIKLVLEERGILDKKGVVKQYREEISRQKNDLLGPAESDESDLPQFDEVYARYQEKLKEFNSLDFDDLLYLPVKLFREYPEILAHYQQRWSYLLIDEYQDTNAAQYELVRLLVEKTHNLFVVGDPDQSIYSWRGAKVENILNFEKDFPGAQVVRLEQNYRSCTNILDAANALIEHNRARYQKNLWSKLGAGKKIQLYTGEDEAAEARFIVNKIEELHEEGIPLNEMVIFTRTNAQSRVFEDRFLLKRIPYVIVGGISFYHRREIKDILAFLRMVQTGIDYLSFARTINLPKRGIGESTLEKIRVGANRAKKDLLNFCADLVQGSSENTFLFKLTSKQKTGLVDYLQLISNLRKILEENNLGKLVKGVIEMSSYLDYLKEDRETYEDRKENLESLIAKAIEWELSAEEPSLEAFLEELSLKSSLDEAENNVERVSLMTLHNGKGLEFTVAFLAGMEEELFPHVNSYGDSASIEEERRLCYVGMTRAKRELYLTHCRLRYIWGVLRSQRPSRFLKEIPSQYLEKKGR